MYLDFDSRSLASIKDWKMAIQESRHHGRRVQNDNW